MIIFGNEGYCHEHLECTWKLIRVINSLAVKSTDELDAPSLRSKKSALDMEDEFYKRRKNHSWNGQIMKMEDEFYKKKKKPETKYSIAWNGQIMKMDNVKIYRKLLQPHLTVSIYCLILPEKLRRWYRFRICKFLLSFVTFFDLMEFYMTKI